VEFIQRPYADADAAALAELFNAMDVAVGMEARITEGETRTFMGLARDHETDTRLLVTADGRVIGAAVVPPVGPGAESTHIFGGVHPEFQRQGLGRDLFAWQLRRIAELHDELAPGADWLVTAYCDTRDIASTHLYIRYGLAPVRYYAEMQVDLHADTLDGLTDFPAPDGLRLVAYHPDFLESLHAAHMEAFADHWGFTPRERDEWADLSVRSGEFRADLSRIAVDGSEIAGYVLVYDTLDPDRMYVRSVGTRARWRGRGVASALLADVLRGAAEIGRTGARLEVDAENATGALGVYTRLGFEVGPTVVAYGARLSPSP
jgi:ribosomal protein S18 acetylase RimI-like enzyme